MDTKTQPSLFDAEFAEQLNTQQLSAGFPEKLVLLDCETTGGKATFHRIIEIGLIVVEQGKIVETWESFIQPDQSVPEAITRLTGITTAMLEGAPRFGDIAELLLEKLQGRVFVAHNARFDYGFIKNEFSRVGIKYNGKTLCSVKFSRLLYPQFKRHGLDQIIKRFGFTITNRHRAFDDADMIYQFFLESSRLFAAEDIAAVCSEMSKRPTLPSKLSAKIIDNLPTAPGVYYFYDERGELLYVGKSVNIRHRVLNHFSQDHKNPKDLRMSSRIAHVSCQRTASDFSAQLLESQEIKRLSPTFNRRLRKTKKLYGLTINNNPEGYAVPHITAQETHQANEEQYGLFRTRYQVIKKLEHIADEFQLCHRLLGLEKSHSKQAPCFRFQLKKCAGACCGKEQPSHYNQRLLQALADYQRKVWPWPHAVVVKETDAEGTASWHLIKHWVYIEKLALPEDVYHHGLCFAEGTGAVKATIAGEIKSAPEATPILNIHTPEKHEEEKPEAFDLDTYFILVRFLLNRDNQRLSGLSIHPLAPIDTTYEY